MAVAQRLLPLALPFPAGPGDREGAPSRPWVPTSHPPSERPPGPRGLLPPELQDRLQTARELSQAAAEAPREELFASGLPAVDRLLAGGLARGRLVELRGAPGSGRFACALALLAQATGRGEPAALVDLGDQLDPQQAREQGIDLSRLLWLRPPDLTAALAAAEVALAGAFPLVVLELGLPPILGGRGREAAWRRLARAARHHRGALLVSSPYRVSGSAAAEAVWARPERALWQGVGTSPRLLAGARSRLELEKGRGAPGREPTDELVLARAEPAVTPPAPAAAPQEGCGPREHRQPNRAAAGRR